MPTTAAAIDSAVDAKPTQRRLADAERTDLSELVDTDRYPLHDVDDSRLQAEIARVREDLDREGCAVLRGFLRPEALEQARNEGRELSAKSYYASRRVNAWFTSDDESLPESDPRRHFMERTSGFVTRDMIPADAVIQQLYVSPAMKRLVAECLQEDEVYEYADPFAGLVQNVLPPGTEQPWHYDTNEYIVTMMTDIPDSGGEFQYCPNIRTPAGENYDGVGAVIRGEDTTTPRTLLLRPGDLQLFKGRYSLHRVTRVSGERERHTAIFAYSQQPGVVGRLERTRQLYGRVSEAHIEAEKRREERADGLLD
ncbi:phytanoyl-CoA dioxygenase family protein [Chromohalobacter moromii]|uniref:Phytanoyl-CoA dioxygenase family protein n=1 Tax=Chromohalobacter moromii TaxID=2860329 RepID=A0A9X2X163_9GAMM|nr:phytanoyl-CoA dioxygenase family protein [Chromohalobacter moromii]MCT8504770.1 phytanoyl-CoA dioxygenase family protein [Chromohalobacter moromii]